jgi:hypothetical protein
MTVTGLVVGWRIKAAQVRNGKAFGRLSSMVPGSRNEHRRVSPAVTVAPTASPNWNLANISGTIAPRIQTVG